MNVLRGLGRLVMLALMSITSGLLVATACQVGFTSTDPRLQAVVALGCIALLVFTACVGYVAVLLLGEMGQPGERKP